MRDDSFWSKIKKDYSKNYIVVYMMIIVVAYYVVFHYLPMYGVTMAFQDFNVSKGIFGSQWVGLKHFKEFFSSIYAWRTIRNTLLLSFYQLLFGFPFPIILALLLNEVRVKWFKKTVQSITYLPHFISVVVVCGMVVEFTSQSGLINDIIAMFGGERVSFLLKPEWFRPIYVTTSLWQSVGWDSIIYLAALAGVDPALYEAAYTDGANRFRQFWHVTLPSIAPTIIVLFILNIGKFMSQGAEKVILLYNENVYETADVISSFVYRRGLINADYSFSTAVGLFNSVINLILVVTANTLSRKFSESSLW
ncbi:ABC transporter permease subunit [Acetivibrio sp. MSJd-27]|uniref:ABC transporter permease n=1 Tax=Acetivibrio sp. MSJd-27 TaxID=2841523 RepID=UPI0027DEBB52|nr:ABC transporter permease subunit [Acetivibrio sp. MSJd-27]